MEAKRIAQKSSYLNLCLAKFNKKVNFWNNIKQIIILNIKLKCKTQTQVKI